MITLKQLQCFVSVVKQGGFYNASLVLNLTQPSVTKAVSNLEDELGTPLFDKPLSHRKREIELTEVGKLVYDQAIGVLQQIEDIGQSVNDYHQMAQGKLRLGVSPLGGEVLTEAIFEFYQQFPNIELSLTEQGAESLKQDLLNNELDVATLMQPIGEEFAHLAICDYPVMVVALRQRLGKNIKQIKLKSLSNAPLILMANNSSFTNMITEQCQKVGFEPTIICHTNQLDLLLNLVKKNMGVTILPLFYSQKINDENLLSLPLVEPNLNWQMAMAWRKNRPITPSMQAWLTILQNMFQ